MSGLAAVFHRDGEPIPRRTPRAILRALTHRGPDGCDLWHDGPVAVGHHHFWTTPEELGERQPVGGAGVPLRLALDGRLDNREEILRALGLDDPDGRAFSDASIMLRAFERWDTGCFARFLGSFAVVVADPANRRLVAARDQLGNRTLFFHLSERLAVVASEEWAVLQHLEIDREIDEGHLTAYLALELPSSGSTLFRAVTELWPAHVLDVGPAGHSLRRYWDVDVSARVRYRDDREYGEHFRDVLSSSVACRMRSPNPPAILMSGGLDSTAVAALAAQRLRTSGSTDRPRAFSWVFSELRSCDEREYIEEVHRHLGSEAVYVPGDDAWPLSDFATRAPCPGRPDFNPYRRLKARLWEAARERGHTCLLSGALGDDLHFGAGSYLVDLALDLRLRAAVVEAPDLLRRFGPVALARQLALGFPPWARFLYRRDLDRRGAPWVRPEASALLPDLVRWPPSALCARRPAQHRMLLGLASADNAAGESPHASRCGVEVRLPYRDRRLVEFALALPAQQLFCGGRYKVIARNAMSGLLPERVRMRTHPTVLTPLMRRGLCERESEIVDRLLRRDGTLIRRLLRDEWLDRAASRSLRTDTEELVRWLCVAVELWHTDSTRDSGRTGEAGRFEF